MKKLILAAALLFSMSYAQACEICGCSGSGSQFFGILPGYKNNFIGIRYQYRSFTSHHLPLFSGASAPTTQEHFSTTEVWGRLNLAKKLQLFAFVPFQNYHQSGDGEDKNISGIGDASLMLGYRLINTGEGRAPLKQQLQMAGGVKLPTGAFTKTDKTSDPLNINLQPGSGSVDVPLNFLYTIRYKKTGVSTEANYRFNNTNKDNYKFGDRFSTSAKFFRWVDIGHDNSVLPNAGITYEHAAKDFDGDEYNDYSGGHLVSATLGIETYISRFSVGVQYLKPLTQTMASGQIDVHDRLTAQVSFKF